MQRVLKHVFITNKSTCYQAKLSGEAGLIFFNRKKIKLSVCSVKMRLTRMISLLPTQLIVFCLVDTINFRGFTPLQVTSAKNVCA